MRYFILLFAIAISFTSCKKDKYTTEPQIRFISITPNVAFSNLTIQNLPVLTLELTDAEGDLGFKSGMDTSMFYIKNIKTLKEDSAFLPDLSTSALSNFKGEVSFVLGSVLGSATQSSGPKTDTLFFEVYVKDFAKNKSNVLVTTQPVYYITP